MVCTQCGAYAETNIKYCKVCGAPMPAATAEQDTYAASDTPEETDAPQPVWSFVRSPQWPKPEFDINTVDKLPHQAAASVNSYAQQPHSAQAPSAGGEARPPYPRDSVAKPRSPAGNFNPEPVVRRPPAASATPMASVGGYEGDSTAYQGEFGRAPQRVTDYSDDEDENFASVRPRTSPVVPSRKAPAPAYAAKKQPAGKQGAANRTSGRKASTHGKRRNSMIYFGAAGVLVVLLIVFGIVIINKNYGSIGGFFSNVFGGSPIIKPAEISEGLNEQGVDCHIITVYAREGNTVILTVGGEKNSGVIGPSNFKALRIPKSDFLPEEPVDEATVELKADVQIMTADGEIVPVDVPAIKVDVPQLVFDVLEPSGSPAYVNRTKVPISGKVSGGDVSVTIEGQSLTVDENGNFSGEYVLPGLGVYTLNLEARKNGYQIARKSVQVDYSVAQAEIDLEKATLRTPKSSNKTTVKGTITAGSTLQITAPSGVTAETPTVDSATGAFSFNVQIDSEGSYEIACVVTKDGLGTNGVITVERAPDLDTYSRACQQMDYTRMTTERNHIAKYVCSGKVTEIVSTEPYTLAKLETDRGTVMFEYHGTAATIEAGDGKTYNVYADYKGIDEESGLPLVYGWFIIKPSR